MLTIKDNKARELPAMQIADRLNLALSESGAAVVTAPPGAGKSTLLPLTIFNALQDNGKVLMLEPRRLAARQIAERMSAIIGESVGKSVGYRVRFESRVSAQTRIEVLTEGILTRMLVSDPTLDGVSCVIFDEFHERRLNSDLDLALVREIKQVLRPDLKIVVMSATIDAQAICKALDAPLVESEGRMFPVKVEHAEDIQDPYLCAEKVAHQIRIAHRDNEGDILAFLPGEADIRKCAELLGNALGSTRVLPLYGMLSSYEQQEAIAPSPAGSRKVVLATPIAETSLTIEGVRVVVDSGYCRKLVFDPQNELSHLETVRISMDMARQRTGRAGRVASGICYRMWSLGTESRMKDSRVPEILESDLAPTILEVAAWGENDIQKLSWLTPPPSQNVISGSRTLKLMGALDDNGNITALGRRIAELPCHPRIAKMMVHAGNPALKALAADIAAVLEEKDPLASSEDADICTRIDALRRARSSGRNDRSWNRIIKIAEQYRQLVKVAVDNESVDPFEVGALIAEAYPERVAKMQANSCGEYLLSCAQKAAVDRNDALIAYEWLAAASVKSRDDGGVGRIFLAAPVDPLKLTDLICIKDNLSWDAKKGSVVCQRESRIGSLLVSSRRMDEVPREEIVKLICEAAVKEGLSMFDFSDEVQNLQRRIAAVSAWRPELELPDVSTESVLAMATEWLPAYIGKASTAAELKKIDMCAVIWGLLDYNQQQDVDKYAPTHISVPTGSRIRVEYRQGAEAPVLRVRLQECFGQIDTPRVDGGRRTILMELLSPGFKPVQLTSDLRSFWEGTYFEVRKELKRRYPKHSWPDNPLEAEAVRGRKKP